MPSGGQCSTTWNATTAPSFPPGGVRAARGRRPPRPRDPALRQASTETGFDSMPLAGIPAALSSPRNSPRPQPDVEHRARQVPQEVEVEALRRGRSPRGLPRKRSSKRAYTPAGIAGRGGVAAAARLPGRGGAAGRGLDERQARLLDAGAPRELVESARDLGAQPVEPVGEAGRGGERERVEGRLVAPEEPQRADREALERRERGALGHRPASGRPRRARRARARASALAASPRPRGRGGRGRGLGDRRADLVREHAFQISAGESIGNPVRG